MRDIKNPRATFFLLGLLFTITACTIFQRDPVGASLVTMRNGYESVIKESALAYNAGAINKTQLTEIVDVGTKFHESYTLAVNAHLIGDEQDSAKGQEQTAALLSQLEALARKYFAYKGAK